eukprot:tig00000342_g24221.t1
MGSAGTPYQQFHQDWARLQHELRVQPEQRRAASSRARVATPESYRRPTPAHGDAGGDERWLLRRDEYAYDKWPLFETSEKVVRKQSEALQEDEALAGFYEIDRQRLGRELLHARRERSLNEFVKHSDKHSRLDRLRMKTAALTLLPWSHLKSPEWRQGPFYCAQGWQGVDPGAPRERRPPAPQRPVSMR